MSIILQPTRYDGGMAGTVIGSPDHTSLPCGAISPREIEATQFTTVLDLVVAWYDVTYGKWRNAV